MANFCEVTDEMIEGWKQWATGRPKVVQDLAERFKPWKLYRLKTTGHRVFLLSFFENGTVTAAVTGRFNLVAMERQVFGIDPADLEECELPSADEMVGVYLSEGEQLLMTNRRRAEHGLPALTIEEFSNLKENNQGLCVVDGRHAGEPFDDVPPPKEAVN